MSAKEEEYVNNENEYVRFAMKLGKKSNQTLSIV